MARFATEEDYKHFLHCEVIEDNFAYLCDNINPSDHVDFLRSKRILDQEAVEDIMSQNTTRQRCRSFLGYIKRRGPTAFPLFLTSLLQNRTQVFIAKTLHKSLEKLEDNPPQSILERRPISSAEQQQHEEFGSRVLVESDERMSVEERNNPHCNATIELQLPEPGQPGGIPLPGRQVTPCDDSNISNNVSPPMTLSSDRDHVRLIAHRV